MLLKGPVLSSPRNHHPELSCPSPSQARLFRSKLTSSFVQVRAKLGLSCSNKDPSFQSEIVRVEASSFQARVKTRSFVSELSSFVQPEPSSFIQVQANKLVRPSPCSIEASSIPYIFWPCPFCAFKFECFVLYVQVKASPLSLNFELRAFKFKTEVPALVAHAQASSFRV